MESTKYDIGAIEEKWYRKWEESGYFKPSMEKGAPSFCIQLPPPNVTGTLHMGHAFNQTIMDGLVRYHRMKGDNTLWVPGQDHAGIATQIVVERQLKEKGVSRLDLGREKFVDKIWEWKEESGGTIINQMRRMGCSCDWDRKYFTMDEKLANAVTEVFVRLYEDGLIYRNKKLINWDPVLKTAISDLEVVNEEEAGHMWHIRYPLKDDPSKGMVVATTRPETMLGDVAVAVNPEDDRYKDMIGKHLVLPLVNREIPIVGDPDVDMEFGTGCVKITPAHDFTDYAIGKRHELKLINIFDLEANILKEADVYNYDGDLLSKEKLPEAYAGLSREDARKAIVADLEKAEILVKIEPHALKTPRGDRTGTAIEPMLTDQWFVAMSQKPSDSSHGENMSLQEHAKRAVESGEVRFVPQNWINTYNQWINNIEDWCISRQLWWGHQIPAWYDDEGNIYVARNEEEAKAKAGGKNLRRDEDVLDTWFSSALVPFSSLGWPNKSDELECFLPSNVLVTGYEIIFFWVARMIMMTSYFTGKVPFHEVYIHGMVKDHVGRKMSKSEGNVIDPVDLIEGIGLDDLLKKRVRGLRRPETAPTVIKETKKLMPDGIPSYGTDALRFTMASYASLGRSILFDFKRCEGYRNFCNKIWNASRFVLMNTNGMEDALANFKGGTISWEDRWIRNALARTIEKVTEALDTFRFDLAANHLYEFMWNEYCDWYVEMSKVKFFCEDEELKLSTLHNMIDVLETTLRLLHPIMPFITEELWQTVAPLIGRKGVESIMLAPWPKASDISVDDEADKRMETLKALVEAVRTLRGEMEIPIGQKVPLVMETKEDIGYLINSVPHLARLSFVTKVAKLPEGSMAPVIVLPGMRLMLDVKVDKEEEKARINKEMEKLQKSIDKMKPRLENPSFVEKAPKELVEKEKKNFQELVDKMNHLKERLDKLG